MTDPVPSIDPTVAADIAADKKGEERPTEPTPPPPGTELPGFFQREGTNLAIVLTVGLGLMYLRGYITKALPTPEELAVAIEAVVWAWLGAVGISRLKTDALRWK